MTAAAIAVPVAVVVAALMAAGIFVYQRNRRQPQQTDADGIIQVDGKAGSGASLSALQAPLAAAALQPPSLQDQLLLKQPSKAGTLQLGASEAAVQHWRIDFSSLQLQKQLGDGSFGEQRLGAWCPQRADTLL